MRFRLVEDFNFDRIQKLFNWCYNIAKQYYPELRTVYLEMCKATSFLAEFSLEGFKIRVSEGISDETDFNITETLLHELAHAIAEQKLVKAGKIWRDYDSGDFVRYQDDKDSKPHSNFWRTIAIKLGQLSGIEGIHPEDVAKQSEFLDKYEREKQKYRVFCPSCGAEWRYQRACKIVKYPERFLCTRCNIELQSEEINKEG